MSAHSRAGTLEKPGPWAGGKLAVTTAGREHRTTARWWSVPYVPCEREFHCHDVIKKLLWSLTQWTTAHSFRWSSSPWKRPLPAVRCHMVMLLPLFVFFAASNRTIGPWSPRRPHREQTDTTSAWTYQSDTPEYLMPDISNVNNTVPLHVLHPSERYATGATLRLIFDSNLSLQTSELLCWSQERSRCLATHTHAHTLVRPYSLELVFDHGSSTVLQIQRVKNNECVVYNHNKKKICWKNIYLSVLFFIITY